MQAIKAVQGAGRTIPLQILREGGRLFGGGDTDSEGMELQEAFPKGFGTGMTIAFASEEATETGDHSDPVT